jgi:hypothetical protein
MVRDIASKSLAAAGKTIKKARVKSITFHLKQGSILGVEKAVSILTTTIRVLVCFCLSEVS